MVLTDVCHNHQNYGGLSVDYAESYCAFIGKDFCLLLPSVMRVSFFFADDSLVYQRGVRYQMFWYTQRNTQPVPSEHAREAVLRWRQSVSPHP